MGIVLLIEFAFILISGLAFYTFSLQCFSSKYAGRLSLFPRLHSVLPLVQSTFGLTFAACSCLFELILFEIFGLFQELYYQFMSNLTTLPS